MSGLGEFLSSTAGGSAAGAAVDIGSGFLGSYFGRKQQERLFDYQQDGTLNRMRALGATPASMIQAFNGAVGGSMPSVSSPSPMTSLGSNLVQASQVQSENNRREIENQYDRMKLQWDPKRWQNDIDKIKSEVFKNYKESKYFDAIREYNLEFAETLRQKRPWEIATEQKGIALMQAEIEERESRKTLNYASAENQYAQANTEAFKSIESYQRGRALAWENDHLREYGIDPNQPLWQNIGRLAFTEPDKANAVLGSFQQTLRYLDNNFKDDFGKEYKRRLRNMGLAFGAARMMRGMSDRMWNRAEQASRIFGNVMPFMSPSGQSFAPSVPVHSSYNDMFSPGYWYY